MTYFGKLSYFRTDEIALPIVFGGDVIWFEKTDLTITKVSGSEPAKMCYCVNNKVENGIIRDDKYKVIFLPAHGTAGAIFVDITGEVIKKANLVGEFAIVDPVLISYNRLPVAIKDMSTPDKTSDGWWNVEVEFEYPVVGLAPGNFIFGVDIASPEDTALYRAATLDVQPTEPPPAFGRNYVPGGYLNQHCVGDWEYEIYYSNTVQAKYFWLKFRTDSQEMPEVSLIDPEVLEFLTPVSVAP